MIPTSLSGRLKFRQLVTQQPWIGVIPVMLIAAGLGFYQLGSESLWIDELYSVHDAISINLTLGGFFEKLSHIRPLYYILLRLWSSVSQDEAWLRSFSVIAGVGSVLFTYRLGRQIAGNAVGILAALMLAMSPMVLYFSQMVRMYAMGTCLGIVGSFFLALALETPKTQYLVGWAVMRGLVFLTAPLNLTLLAPDIILLGLTFRKQPQVLKEVLKWLCLIGLLCLPSAHAFWVKTWPFLRKALGITENVAANQQQFSVADILLDFFRKIRKFTVFPFPSTSAMASRILHLHTVVMIGLAGVAFYKNRHASRMMWVAAWAFVPWLVHAAVSHRMLFDRYIVYTAPYLIILLAAGLVRVWRMHHLTAGMVAIAYFLIATMGLGRYYTVQDRQDWRALFAFINQHEQPGDTIVYSMELENSDKFSRALRYYHAGDAAMVYIPALCERPRITTPTARLRLEEISAPLEQAWLLCGSGFEQDKFAADLGNYGQIEGHWQFVNHAFYRHEDYMNLFKVRFIP